MKKYIFLFYSIVLLLPLSIKAQDTIFKKNNPPIVCKVIEVGPDEIKYKRTDIPDGPVYTEKKKNIESVHYSNGSKEVYKATPEIVKANPASKQELKPRYLLT